MEINISDLTWSKFIYPRGGKSEKTVEAYVEALGMGAQFPPIKIQRVLMGGRGAKNVLDRGGTNLIDANELERVADELGGEFDRLLDESELD